MPSPYEPEGPQGGSSPKLSDRVLHVNGGAAAHALGCLRLGSVMPSCRARSEPQPSSPMPRCPHQSDRALSKVAHLGQRPDFASLGCDGCCAGRRTRVCRSTSFESALGLWRRGRAGGSSSSRRAGRLTLRRELRAAPGGLESDGGFLRGRYVSSLSERCDVENILFYNVGSVFAQATAAGVQFERVYAKPPEPPAPIQGLHYHRYELAAGETPFAHWRPGELIASFADVRLPRLAATTRVSEVWQALREAPLETATPQTQAALLVRLRVCSSAVGAATSFVKPLLGVVSALHAHDDTFA